MTKEILDLKEQLTSIKRTDEKIILLPTYTGYLFFIADCFEPLGCIEIYVKCERGTYELILLHVKPLANSQMYIERLMEYANICRRKEVK